MSGPTHRHKGVPCPEYLRRHILHCKSIGAAAEVKFIRRRLSKSAPKWLLKSLDEIEQRVVPLQADLVLWRDAAPDYPYEPIPPEA